MKKNYYQLRPSLTLKYFWQVIRRYQFSFWTVILATSISAFLDVYIPLQYLKLWNLLDANNFSIVTQAQSVIFLVLILNLLRWSLRRLSGFTLAFFESSVMAGLRNQAFSYLIGHSHSFFANNFIGSLTQKINRYAKAFEKITDRLVVDGLPLIIRTLGTVIAIYTLFPKYAYLLAIFCFVFLTTTFFYIRWKLKYDLIMAESDSKTVGIMSDSVGNHSAVQLFNGQEFEKENVQKITNQQRKFTAINWYLWEGLGSINSFYSLSIEFIILWLVLKDWQLGLITLPVIVLLQSYLFRLIDNLWSFGNIVRTFYEGFADAQEMVQIIDTPYEILENLKENFPKEIKGAITFENVSYLYENNNGPILKDFSLRILPLEKVALIGISGSGKTTFVRLLMRFFDVQQGSIFIDKTNIKDVSLKELRNLISFVPQDPILFHRTLMENIRYGRKEATDSEVIEAAKLAHCDEFIDNLPQKYETYVGERGIKLSGGEKQRIAIARAILKNAPILILDEATSSLDSKSEFLIQDALQKLLKNKTALIIAHRLSTIRKMDRIIVLEKGRIAEDGTHQELISKEESVYRKLWNLQAKGFDSNF